MESIVLGEGASCINEVAQLIEKSASFAALQIRWRSFANFIGVKNAELPGIERRINSGLLQLREIPREVLLIWKADKGSNATLKTLCDALVECNLNDIAETLKEKFFPTELKFAGKFILHEKIYSLEQLFENNAPEGLLQLIKSHWDAHIFAVPIPIIRKEVCLQELPEFYIPRTFLSRSQLDQNVFKVDSTKEHVFLVKNAPKLELARACGFKPIERSGNQLDNVTVQHVLLECEDDFLTISGRTTKPTHMIEFKDGLFLHIKSSSGIDKIQAFIKESGVSFSEHEAINRFSRIENPCALSIADSPGMGKTFVLSKLAAQIQESNPKAIVLFLVLQELALTLQPADSASTVIETISTYASFNELSKIILKEMMTSKNFQFYFFLDGYDEVMDDKLDMVDLFIQRVVALPNAKAIITSRPHLKSRVENILHRLSLQIEPFSESNRIEFLTKYWSSKHGAKNGEILPTFAKRCLKALEINMTDQEKDIAGIPLQCSMLAEVYAEHAKRASKLDSLPEDAVNITSFFEMYKSLMELKFKRIGSSSELRRKYFDAHVHDSIALLFPERLERFKPILSPREEVEESVMYSIGLIEKAPSSSSTRFLHRTFAENLLAQFLVWNHDKVVICLQFLFTEIFGELGTIKKQRPGLHSAIRPKYNDLKHSVVAYFVEMHLRDRIENNDIDKLHCLEMLRGTYISYGDMCFAANACCSRGLENCFGLTKFILEQTYIKNGLSFLRSNNFHHLPHLVVERTENISLLKIVLTLTKEGFYKNLDWHVIEQYMFTSAFIIPDCTPLHVAVCHGKYNMVTYLLKKYGEDVLQMKFLIHCCLFESAKNSKSVIEDKLSIIEALTKLNKEWLEEYFEDRQPILQTDVHVQLIKYLVQLGVSINTHSEIYGTILHEGADKSTYPELLSWAMENGFDLINHVNKFGNTALTKAMVRLRTLDDNVIGLFYDAGADFSAKDKYGDSLLFLSITYRKSVNFIRKVLDFGALLTDTKIDGENAIHLVIEYCRDSPIIGLELLELFESRGFEGLHQKDKRGITPVKKAVKIGIVDYSILRYLVQKSDGDEQGNSVLFHALESRKDVDLIQKLLSADVGENVNHRNKKGENAAHVVFKSRNSRYCTNEDYPYISSVLKRLVLSGFIGFAHNDDDNNTPFSIAIEHGMPPEDILNLLVEKPLEDPKRSLLFHSIQQTKNLDIIEALFVFEDRVNVNQQNELGENAAHLIIQYHKDDPNHVLNSLKMLESKGFTGCNQSNSNGQTPLGLAKKLGIKDGKLLQFLKFKDPNCSIL